LNNRLYVGELVWNRLLSDFFGARFFDGADGD
jgi:hypothetical protein